MKLKLLESFLNGGSPFITEVQQPVGHGRNSMVCDFG